MCPRLAIVALTLVACAGPSTSADGRPIADVTIPLAPYFRDLRAVRAVVGLDTLTLLFDTGGGATLISPAVAARIGCRPYGRDVGHRMTGERVMFERCDSLTMSLSGWSRRLPSIAVFDVNALLPPELPRLDGVLALDVFRGEVITLDWPSGTLIVHEPQSGNAALAARGVTVRVATGETGGTLTLLARVEARRGLLWFLIDSGNLRGTLVDSMVQRDSLLAIGPDSLVALRIGNRTPLRLPFQTGTFILDGVLGTDFLQRGAVSFDLRPFSSNDSAASSTTSRP